MYLVQYNEIRYVCQEKQKLRLPELLVKLSTQKSHTVTMIILEWMARGIFFSG